MVLALTPLLPLELLNVMVSALWTDTLGRDGGALCLVLLVYHAQAPSIVMRCGSHAAQ